MSAVMCAGFLKKKMDYLLLLISLRFLAIGSQSSRERDIESGPWRENLIRAPGIY